MPSPNVPNKETRDFPRPAVVVDTLLTEPSSSYVGTYAPVEPGQPYINLNHSVAQAGQYAGLFSLGQKVGKDREFQERFWASDPATQDIDNFSVEYGSKDTTLPIFKRIYKEKRDTYTPRANLSPLTSLYAVRVTVAGSGYDPNNPPAVTCNNGATAIALVNPTNGAIAKITLKNEGVNCTTTVTIAAPPAGGVQANAVGVLQPANCLLIDEAAIPAPDPWGALYLQVDRTYETLPGDILIDDVPDPELSIPTLTTVQRRAATDFWPIGEFSPASLGAFNISSATIATQTVITLTTGHDFVPGEYVIGAGTAHTTPTLNGTFQVVDTTPTTITLALAITGISGTIGGAFSHASYVTYERRKTDNANVVLKVTTRAAVADVTTYNQETEAFRPYPFPDALIEILGYSSDTQGMTTETTEYGYSFSWSGGIGFKILPGFRGDCQATRFRVFSMGPITTMPTDPLTGQPYAPTVVMPAVGTVTCEGGAQSLTETLTGETTSMSDSWKGENIPPVLTSAFSGSVTNIGTGEAVFSVDLPDAIIKDPGSSARSGWVQGDIITTIDPPEKLRGIGVYMTTIWQIVVPYTTGVGPV
jgi:hypothetical protein